MTATTSSQGAHRNSAASPRGGGLGRLLRDHWPVVVLGVAVVAATITVRHLVYPAYSWNRDEPVYLWQIRLLHAGQFTSTDGGAPQFFRPWLSAAQGGVLFSQYTLGWPLVLFAADVVFGSPDAALALGAVLAVLGTYALARELSGDDRLALVSAVVMAACPILVIQGGVYLGYLFTLGLGLLFGTALLSGVRRHHAGRLLVAGVLLGWIFLTRPYDALLWGAAVGGYVLCTRLREWRRLVAAAGWVAVGVVPLVVITLAYNARVTGHLTTFPITAADPLDTFGFGRRRIMPTFAPVDYGLRRAAVGSAKNTIWFPLFLAGSYLGVVLAAIGLWVRRRDVSTIAVLAIGLVFPIGYFFFWGTHISALTSQLSGPIYFVPAYAPMSILIAAALLAAWRRRRALGIAAVAAMVVVTIPVAANRLQVNRAMSRAQLPWKGSTRAIDGRALVFVSGTGPYLAFLNPYSSNDPDLRNRVLYASDRGARDLDLIASRPDRTPYLQKASLLPERLGPQTHPPTPEITVTRLRVLTGGAVTVSATITNMSDRPALGVQLKLPGFSQWRPLDGASRRGATYRAQWTLRPAATTAPGQPVVPLTTRLGTATVAVGYGSTDAEASAAPVVSRFYRYRVVGSSVEVLTPGEPARAQVRADQRTWVPSPEPADLAVTVAAG